MARDPPLLSSTAPTTIAPAPVYIGHVQLRDLIICPREKGIVNYVKHRAVVEHNLSASDSTPRTLAELSFTPNTLTSLQIGNGDHTLIAAGGQEAEIHLSLHASNTQRQPARNQRPGSTVWRFEANLPGSINNSVLLTSLSLARSNESSAEPRVGISNNDCTVKFYDIPIRGRSSPKTIKESGTLRLDVPVNHSSISPDGRTLLSVGDSPKVYLHRLTGGSRITFSPIHTLSLPPPDSCPLHYSTSSLAASFSTAFSANGSKFAVASQEGLVVVWDVRSTKPLKVFQTDKTRLPGGTPGNAGNGGASSWLSNDPWDWTRGHSKAPGWSVRSVKFGRGGEDGHPGKELMVFTEHTSLFHVVDARTFEKEEVIRMPSVPQSSANQSPQPPAAAAPRLPIPPPRSTTPPYPSRLRTLAQSQQLPPPPMIVLALESTFRISSSPRSAENTSSTSRVRQRSNDSHPEQDEDDVVVIPPLGDREVEHDLQALLGRHGIRARQHSEEPESERQDRGGGNMHDFPWTPAQADEQMEVDELESDCLSSHTPSRSTSPSPSTNIPIQASPARLTSVSPSAPARHSSRHRTQPANSSSSRVPSASYDADDADSETHAEDGLDWTTDGDLDLAGVCFDPTGGYIYVASTKGIAEWSVRGAGKRWWVGNTWI